jgi:hypothetical protein
MVRIVEFRISQSLTEPEWEILAEFCAKVRRLIGTKVVSSDESAINGKLRYTQDHGMQFEATVPPEEQISEFLMAFRFFYLEKEPTNFHMILSLLGKHAQDPDAREALKILKAQWANSLFQTTMYLSLNDHPVTASLLLDLWFNAHYFHSDKEKGEKLAQLNDVFTESFSKYMLLESTYNATKTIFTIYNALESLINTRRKSAH